LASQTFINHLGEEKYQELVNFCLHYIADLKIPVKRCAPAGYVLYGS
jgi:phosphomannomutase